MSMYSGVNRRQALSLLGLGAAGAMLPSMPAFAATLTKINYMFAFPLMSYIVANQTSIPKEFGFFEAEGIEVEHHLAGQGNVTGALQMVANGDNEIGSGSFEPVLGQAAKGQDMGLVFFYNQIRASHTAVVTNVDSPIKTVADLKGKTIGVQSLGSGPMKIMALILRDNGLDPQNDVTFVSVGIAAQALQALRSGQCDSYVASRGSISSMEALGEKFQFLGLPDWMKEVNGPGLFTRREYLKSNRAQVVGIGRAVAKSTVFVKANPEAAIRIHWKHYPEQVPQGQEFEKAVATATNAMKRQIMVLEFQAHETVKKYGYTPPESSRRVLQIYELEDKISDTSAFYSNDLVDEINNFDAASIEVMAKAFKLPA